ncbi:MAG: phosphorylase [Cyanobacteria bacterium J06623_7]
MEESASKRHPEFLLEPGTLWSKTIQQTQYARQCGALKSIETEYHLIQQQDISFVVRTLANVTRKEQASKQQQRQEHQTGKKIDPFLPYESDLFVGDLSSSHICLLNKFNVVDNHLLIVTRDFEAQTDLLNLRDFEALCSCLREVDGLAFFNGGKTAGASQRHKHLQLLPFPFLADVVNLPIESAIAKISFEDSLGKLASFAFRHGIAPWDLKAQNSVAANARVMLAKYHALLKYVGFSLPEQTQQQPGSYNFLATREWMMVVPRSRESFQNISINSLGFAGSLFVRDRQALATLEKLTPLKLLEEVALN